MQHKEGNYYKDGLDGDVIYVNKIIGQMIYIRAVNKKFHWHNVYKDLDDMEININLLDCYNIKLTKEQGFIEEL